MNQDPKQTSVGFIMTYPVIIKWKVSQHRRDKRTGALSYRPMSSYAKKLYTDAMRKWRES